MVQRRLDFYWRRPFISTRTGVSFLSLPYSIRHRIYILAGLVRLCPVNLNQEGPRSRYLLEQYQGTNALSRLQGAENYFEPYTGSHPLRDGEEFASEPYACLFEYRKCHGHSPLEGIVTACICPPLPASLIYVSREISREALSILYSENSFTVGRSDEWGLKPLHHLSANALQNLRVLTIRFNSCECIYEGKMYGGLFKELRPFQETHEHGLFSCHPLCKQYGFHDRPLNSQARHHAAIFEEMQNLVTKLAAQCQLKLLKLDLICDTQDLNTAQEVTNHLLPLRHLHLCSVRLSQRPSWHHSMLSRQLVYDVSLDSPTKQEPKYSDKIQLLPRSYQLPVEIITAILEYSELIAPFELEWCKYRGLAPFDCCTTCTSALDSCACTAYHGAYSPTCTCWRLPLNIFLVSRQVYNIAQAIFYRRNRFVLVPRGGRLDDLELCKEALPAAADMLNSLPSTATSHIRSLGIVVSLSRSIQEGILANIFDEWEDIISLVQTRFDTSNLCLTLYMNHKTAIHNYSLLRQTYRSFTRRLQRIPQLKDVFIYVDWLFGTRNGGRSELSSELEKEVLGLNYDSKQNGKSMETGARVWTNEKSPFSELVAPDGCLVWPREPLERSAYEQEHPPSYTYKYSH